jgi:hypothetical protein
MGGGNGQKSASSRAKHQAKLDAEGKSSTAETRKQHEIAKNAHQCTICMAGFPRTVKQPELQQHIDAKHPKAGKTVTDCFTTFTVEA